MILMQLKRYLQEKDVTMLQMSTHFGLQPDFLRDMLSVWIDKGKVQRLKSANACSTACSKCNPLFLETYRWVGE